MFKQSAIALAAVATFVGSAQAALSTGNIEVYQGNTLLGYVSKVYDGQNSFTYSANPANALSVQIDPSLSLFSISMLNSPGAPANSYLGAVGGSGGYDFNGTMGYTYFTGTSFTAAGAVPSVSATNDIQVLGYNAPSESTIWSRTGNVLNSVWVNTNGSTSQATLFYDPAVNFLGQVNNLSAFSATFPNEGAYAVSFRFTGDLTVSAVPEPSTYAMMAMGLGLGLLTRRRRSRA